MFLLCHECTELLKTCRYNLLKDTPINIKGCRRAFSYLYLDSHIKLTYASWDSSRYFLHGTRSSKFLQYFNKLLIVQSSSVCKQVILLILWSYTYCYYQIHLYTIFVTQLWNLSPQQKVSTFNVPLHAIIKCGRSMSFPKRAVGLS